MKPFHVWHALNERAAAMNGGSLEAASNARFSITPEQVYALGKQLRRENGFSLATDAAAVAALVAKYNRLGCVPLYQPYKEGGDRAPEQPLVLVLQTPFQARMLEQFGRRVVFLDATGSTNKYGYPLYALVVRVSTWASAPHGTRWRAPALPAAPLAPTRPAHTDACGTPRPPPARCKMTTAAACQ